MYWISLSSGELRSLGPREREEKMSRNRTSSVVRVENLEGRALMTAVPLNVSLAPVAGGTQLRITATANNNQITVRQTAGGLLIGNTGGWTDTITAAVASLTIHGGAGTNSIALDASVTLPATIFGGGVNNTLQAGGGTETLFGGAGKNVILAGNGNDTLVCLGSTADTLVGGAGHDSFWADNNSAEKINNVTAAENAIGAVHRVGGFINVSGAATGKKASVGNARALARASTIKEPAVDAGVGYASFSNDPVFAAAGPSENDIFQGNVGDCYFVASLSATAKVDPTRVVDSVLDLGDGTAIVQLNKGGKPVFVHETQALPVNADGSLAYAGLGAQNSTWVALFEKAWTYVRTNTASYASIDSGWMDEAFGALGAKSTSTYSIASPAALITMMQTDVTLGQAVTYATLDGAVSNGLLGSHAYVVDSIGIDAKGNPVTVTLRNPWGVNADGSGNGYVTITAAQAFKAFGGVVAASI